MKLKDLNSLARILLAKMDKGKGKKLCNLLYYGVIVLWKRGLQQRIHIVQKCKETLMWELLT